MSFAITTEAGLLEGVDPPNDLVRAIAARWPMGIEERVLNNEKCFAIFVEQGEQEVLGVKLQQPDCESEEDAYAWASIRGWQIARAAGVRPPSVSRVKAAGDLRKAHANEELTMVLTTRRLLALCARLERGNEFPRALQVCVLNKVPLEDRKVIQETFDHHVGANG